MNGEHSNAPAPVSTDLVTVRVEWDERSKYATTVEMSRADYERLRTKFVGDRDEVEAAEAEVITSFSLTRVEAHDWDDLEMDVFVEDAPDEEESSEPDEPPDADGECYRGNEYASALADEQARIQRELK